MTIFAGAVLLFVFVQACFSLVLADTSLSSVFLRTIGCMSFMACLWA